MIEKLQFMTIMLINDVKAKRDERGATAVEYGLMVALIAVVIIGAVTALVALFVTLNPAVRRVPRPAEWDSATHLAPQNGQERYEVCRTIASGEGVGEGTAPGVAELGERDVELIGDRE